MSFLVRFASVTARPNAWAWSMSALNPGVFGPSASPTPTTHTRRLTARESNEHRRDACASIRVVPLADHLRPYSADLAARFDRIRTPVPLTDHRTAVARPIPDL